MKKKIIIPILILLLIIPIIIIKINKKEEKKQINKAAQIYKNSIKNHSKIQNIENGNYIVDEYGIHNEKYSYQIELSKEKPQSGSLTIYNNTIEKACLTINNNKIIIENDEIISQEQGICEYESIPTKEEYVKEYILNYVEQIPTTDIKETGVYDINTTNEKIILNEYPTEGWVSIIGTEEKIDVQSYSIKFNDIIVTNIDGTQKITQQIEQRP